MDKIKTLRGISLFADLSADDTQRLSEIASTVSFKKGEHIFVERDIGDALFVITSGLVRVLKKGSEGNEEIARLNSGQPFGEMTVIDKEKRSATVEALEDTELLRIEHGKLKALLAQDDSFAGRVYETFSVYLCRRLRDTTKELTHMMDRTRQLRKMNYYPENW